MCVVLLIHLRIVDWTLEHSLVIESRVLIARLEQGAVCGGLVEVGVGKGADRSVERHFQQVVHLLDLLGVHGRQSIHIPAIQAIHCKKSNTCSTMITSSSTIAILI